MLAWHSIRRPENGVGFNWGPNLASVAGLALIGIAVFTLDKRDPFPGYLAALPVAGAFLMIAAGGRSVVNRMLLENRLMVFIGLISYPLYLWHWPLLTFTRLIEGGHASMQMRLIILSASFILAWLTFEFVEKPLRRNPAKAMQAMVLCAVGVVAAVLGIVTADQDGFESRRFAIEKREILKNLEWDWTTSNCSTKFSAHPCITNSPAPEVLVLGDSHGNHLYPGLTHDDALSVISVGACAPLSDVSVLVRKNADRHPCGRGDVMATGAAIVSEVPSAKIAILAGFWRPALTGNILHLGELETWGGVSLRGSRETEKKMGNEELVFQGLKRSVERMRSLNLRVVILRDTPDIAHELTEFCGLRKRSMSRNCVFPRSEFLKRREPEDRLMARLKESIPSLEIIDPIETFCDAKHCYLMRGGDLYYRDHHHLSVSGSRLIGRTLIKHLSR